MFDKILNKIGLVRKSRLKKFRDLSSDPFTEQELGYLLAETLSGIEFESDSEAEEKLFSEAKKVEGLVEYLKEAAAKDMQRYFGASTPQEQLIIRGSFARTNYLKSRIISGGKKEKTKLEGLRYG